MIELYRSQLHGPESARLDQLLERALSGRASERELSELAEHNRDCAACAAIFALTPQLRTRLRSASEPEPRDRRLVSGALARARSPRRVPRALVAMLAAAVLLVGSLAAARYLGVLLGPEAPDFSVQSLPQPNPAEPSSTRAALPRVHTEPDLGTPARPSAQASVSADVKVAAGAKQAPAESASELFARAKQLRRAGRDAEAITAYRRLQHAHAGTEQALLSHATLGALLLQTGNSKDALEQFDRYAARGGPVLEEALAGRARALGQLGSVARERTAWRELLQRFPNSVHAVRARARLAELDVESGAR